MCEYCDGSSKPIRTEVDGDARMTVTPDDGECPEGFLLDVYPEPTDGTWYSFVVPCCPMCGRRLEA
jgi:hypothetical protein